MLNKEELVDDIRIGFAIFQNYIRPGGSLNLTDINIHAEDFVSDVLNSLHGWRLSNTNKLTSNHKCIDLFDPALKLGIQVTSEGGSGKINKTIECLAKHGMDKHISELKVFSLIPRQGSYTVHKTCKGVAFAWRTDVLDFDSILREIININDLANLKQVHGIVTKSLPMVFASKRNKLEKICEQVRKSLTVFDREVMWALENQEDPVEMYRAIRQMRTSIQKLGALRIANEIARNNFTSARQILRDTELKVKDLYLYIHEAAIRLNSNQVLLFDDYNNTDYRDSIRLMMGIRHSLNKLIVEIEDELERIEMLL